MQRRKRKMKGRGRQRGRRARGRVGGGLVVVGDGAWVRGLELREEGRWWGVDGFGVVVAAVGENTRAGRRGRGGRGGR